MIHAPAPRVRLLIRESAAAWKLFSVARQRLATSTRGASYSSDTYAYEPTFEGLRDMVTWEALDGSPGNRSTAAHPVQTSYAAPAPRVRLLIRSTAAHLVCI